MKREDVFEQLEPPAGGLAKLRGRMEPRVRFLRPAVATLAIAAAVLLFFWSRSRTPDLVAAARQNGGLEQVALGLAPPHGESASLAASERGSTALAEVKTSSPAVAFYWVSSTSWDTDPPR